MLLLAACGQSRQAPPLCRTDGSGPPFQLALADHWSLQSTARVDAADAVVATAGFDASSWHAASVPTTVVAALAADGTYPDPYFGMNLRSLPGGTDYPIGQWFSNLPMSDANPSSVPWWFRTEFELPPALAGRRVWLQLGGVEYRAEVWLNGRRIADEKTVAGTYRSFELDVTDAVSTCAPNALAVKVRAPTVNSLEMNWVDWAPWPPDKNQGLWRPVSVLSTGPVRLRAPNVLPVLDDALDAAALTVTVDVENAGAARVSVHLDGHIDVAPSPGGEAGPAPPPIDFADDVTLEAGERRTLRFAPDRFAALAVAHPLLWWPIDLGPQNLYALGLRATVDGSLSDQASARFGVRSVGSELTAEGYRLFRVNGRRLLIRGAGYTPDLLLRYDPRRVADQIAYVKEMHLNAVRLEGKLGDPALYDACDEQGILVMAGWCCCDHWEMWTYWSDEDQAIQIASLEDQIRQMRSHPSMLAWLEGSDAAPPNDPLPNLTGGGLPVEKTDVDLLHGLDWPAPILNSANSAVTPVLGASGVKMPGPYKWVPPNYWSLDTAHGGAFGFNTETSCGEAVPPVESLRKFLPADHLWPVDEQWSFHSGGSGGTLGTEDLSAYTAALEARYGPSSSVDDFAEKSQLAAYEGVRAMFEAYGRNKYHATGVIQWMLDDPSPRVIWHLYDYYLKPAGGYFGAKRACEPLHVQYGYDDGTVVVVNSTPQSFPSLTVRASILDLALNQRWSGTRVVDVGDDASLVALNLPDPAGLAGLGNTYFLQLTLMDAAGANISRNFYWLSQKPDIPDWANANYWYTPTASFADFSALAQLPAATVAASATRTGGDPEQVSVQLQNRGSSIALMVRAEIARGAAGDEVVPIQWDDNYVTLLPGEARTVTARYRAADLNGDSPSLRLSAFNLPVAVQPIP
jgi:exo-1,4-beta-D-glucosaminidase